MKDAQPIDVLRLKDRSWYLRQFRQAIPPALPPIIRWAEANVHLNGAQGEMYRADATPWTRFPIELCDKATTRFVTFIKPIRTGGSAAGHVVLCRWLLLAQGQVQYNWPKQDKSEEMWEKEIERILLTSPAIRRMMPREYEDGLVVFPNTSLTVQGVFTEDSLDSDTVPYQINEEIHAWKPGHLAKAYGRGEGCDFPVRFNISNASIEHDQLHEAFKSGTMRQWEVQCPGCKKYHVMRTRWDDTHPELGGLWYDKTKCKRKDGTYDYPRMRSTLVFKMPCGHIVHDDLGERLALSASGRYSDPYNTGASPGNESMTYQAVACHKTNWLALIEQRNTALRARRSGDEKSWMNYLQQRECVFYSNDQIPYEGLVVLTAGVRKNREGLPNRASRLAAADWQQGSKLMGELSHYWLVIEDVLENCSSQIVFEGMVQTDTELVAVLDEHKVPHTAAFVDASKNTKAILEFCYRNNLSAVMGNISHQQSFLHKRDGVRRFYAENRPIHLQLGAGVPPKYHYLTSRDGWTPSPQEPIVLFYNKAGLLANHFFIREHKSKVLANNQKAGPGDYIERVIPDDVSDDFRAQNESWIRTNTSVKKTGDEIEGFKKIRHADHMLMCLAYIDMIKDWSGILGDRLAQLGISPA